jgi:hypothetical protein
MEGLYNKGGDVLTFVLFAAAAKFCSSAKRLLIAGNSLSSSNREVKVLCFMVLEKWQFHSQWVQFVFSLAAFPLRYDFGLI